MLPVWQVSYSVSGNQVTSPINKEVSANSDTPNGTHAPEDSDIRKCPGVLKLPSGDTVDGP